MNGNGKMIFNHDGDFYEGQWKNGSPIGEGTFFRSSGFVAVGSFMFGELNGYGRRTWPNGSV